MKLFATAVRPALPRILATPIGGTPFIRAGNSTLTTRSMTMQTANKLKVALAAGQQSLGMWQMIPGANVSRILARTGVDWVCVDCEHGNIDGAVPSTRQGQEAFSGLKEIHD